MLFRIFTIWQLGGSRQSKNDTVHFIKTLGTEQAHSENLCVGEFVLFLVEEEEEEEEEEEGEGEGEVEGEGEGEEEEEDIND